jgi:hypothetical protein
MLADLNLCVRLCRSRYPFSEKESIKKNKRECVDQMRANEKE